MQSLTFITGNSDKVKQLRLYVDIPVNHKNIDLVEVQSLDVATIVEEKAKEAYKYVQSPVLVEDTSLRFCALGSLPGPLIKWFFKELGTSGLCQLLDGYADRSAEALVMFGVYDGHKVNTFVGSIEGSISAVPRGANGFGWDPIFIPRGSEKTWAEMTVEEQKATSMRRIALEKLREYILGH